jgi:murein DD-endopeptidase MepM/ murein hydrolase activator NlpD
VHIGLPDFDGNGVASNCAFPGYQGHQGTDISVTKEQMDEGVDVYAAADGVVLWVFDGKYDNCPGTDPDCLAPPDDWFEAGQSNGYRVCTSSGNYCGGGDCCCTWCFDGGNVAVVRHYGIDGLFATRYDHFKTNSILVKPGEAVIQGQKIGEVGSAGNSTGPHLHFEVWGNGFYMLADPWAGPCGPNQTDPMWLFDPPWIGGG